MSKTSMTPSLRVRIAKQVSSFMEDFKMDAEDRQVLLEVIRQVIIASPSDTVILSARWSEPLSIFLDKFKAHPICRLVQLRFTN